MAEKFEEQESKIVKTLGTMFDYLGLDASLRVEAKGAKLAVKITSPDAGRIIGRKGQTLDSLQLLLNRIMFKDNEEFPHVMLDIDGYARGERAARDEGEPAESMEASDLPPRSERPARELSPNHQFPTGTAVLQALQVRQQAIDAAKEVKRWGESVTMPAMNAHDRRIIHVTLQDDPEIMTESEGDGAIKKVVISLRKEEDSPKKD